MSFLKQINSSKILSLHIGFWLLVWLFYNFFFGFNSNNEKYVFWFSSILIPITIANTYITIYYLLPNYLIKKRYWLFTLYAVYVFIISAYIVTLSIFFGFIYMSELDFKEMPPLSRSLPFILISMYMVVLIVAVFTLLKNNYLSLEKHKTLENKFLQTQLQLKKEELKFLKMQIHPHFLFNTLNTLYGFALKKSDETPKMILKLSNLLDYILYQIDKPTVFLTEELNHIEDYISLEKMRFNNTLHIKFNKKNNSDWRVSPMLLLPFVENSFKHGNLIHGVLTIIIDVSTTKNKLVFRIKNSINQEQNKQKGIGLENIKRRLEMLYSNQYTLEINQTEVEFEVILKIKKNAN